jgi:hypothetical protein
MTDKDTEIQHKLDGMHSQVQAWEADMREKYGLNSTLTTVIDIATFGLGAWAVLELGLLWQVVGVLLILGSSFKYVRQVRA